MGAWTPTPQCPSSALARFFPEGNGLTSNVTGSAHQNTPCNATSTGFCFSGLQSFHYVQVPRSLDPQVAPTAEVLTLQVGRAVYTTHSSVGYLPRDVASLRIRHEQLIQLDFHQLDCSLVGCSDVRAEIVLLYSEKGFISLHKETYNVTEYISCARSAQTSPFTNLRLYCLSIALYYWNANFLLQLSNR